MRCNGINWAVYSPGSWDGFRNDVWALWAGVIMRLEHHLVGGYVRYISPHIIIIIITISNFRKENTTSEQFVSQSNCTVILQITTLVMLAKLLPSAHCGVLVKRKVWNGINVQFLRTLGLPTLIFFCIFVYCFSWRWSELTDRNAGL